MAPAAFAVSVSSSALRNSTSGWTPLQFSTLATFCFS